MEDAAEVHFPSIHDEVAGELVKVLVMADRHMRGIAKALSGLEDQAVQHIIGASRYGETGDTRGVSVLVSVSTPWFSGRSYGLALALADKMLRHGKSAGIGRVIATGLVEANGQGRVDAVDGLTAKLRLIRENLQPGDSIWFPRASLQPDDDEQKALLRGIEEAGGSCHPVSHVDDADGVLWGVQSMPAEHRAPHSRMPSISPRWPAAALVMGLLVIALWMGRGLKAPDRVPATAATGAMAPVPVIANQSPESGPGNKGDRLPVPPAGNTEKARETAMAERSAPRGAARKDGQSHNNWVIQSVDIPTDQY